MRKLALFLAIISWSSTVWAVEYKAKGLRDPFQSLKPEAAKTEAVKQVFQADVEGVLWKSVPPLAILSGRVVRVGSRINGAEVIGISEAGVTVRFNGEEKLLKMKEGA